MRPSTRSADHENTVRIGPRIMHARTSTALATPKRTSPPPEYSHVVENVTDVNITSATASAAIPATDHAGEERARPRSTGYATASSAPMSTSAARASVP